MELCRAKSAPICKKNAFGEGLDRKIFCLFCTLYQNICRFGPALLKVIVVMTRLGLRTHNKRPEKGVRASEIIILKRTFPERSLVKIILGSKKQTYRLAKIWRIIEKGLLNFCNLFGNIFLTKNYNQTIEENVKVEVKLKTKDKLYLQNIQNIVKSNNFEMAN